MIEQIQPTGGPTLTAGAVMRLADSVKGPVFLPGDPGYAEEAEGFDRPHPHTSPTPVIMRPGVPRWLAGPGHWAVYPPSTGSATPVT